MSSVPRGLTAAILLIAGCDAAVRGSDAGVAIDAHETVSAGKDADQVGGDVEAADNDDAAPDAGFDLTRDPRCPASAAYIVLLHGRVVNQDGAGLGSTKAQMCIHTVPADEFLCIQPADTSADGSFTAVVPPVARCIRDATLRFVSPRAARGVTYCKLDLSRTSAESTATVAYAMFDTRSPRILPPEGDVQAERTVVFDDGLEVDLVPFDFFADYAPLAAARVPVDHPDLCFLAGQAAFDGLYVFSPEGDIDGRAPVRVPNTSSLPARTRVRGFVLGGLGCTLDGTDTLVPEAEWAEFGTGQVSVDGRTIAFSPGLPCLGWLAYRAE